MKLTSLVILLSIFNFQVMAQKPTDVKITALTNKIALSLHSVWLKGYRLKNADTPREKAIPLSIGETADSALKKLGYYPKIRINEKGELVQDINQDAKKIVPALNLKLNGGPARAYAEYILNHDFKVRADFVEGSSAVHEIWILNNEWQRESNPGLFVSYSELPNNEKIKDLDVLKVALDQMNPTITQSSAFKNYYKELSK